MKWLHSLVVIVFMLAYLVPSHNSTQYLLNFVIVPICNAFFLTLNQATQKEAIAGCAQKGMVLADMTRTDCYELFGTPGVKIWINTYAGLGCPPVGKEKTAITYFFNPIAPTVLRAFPVAEDESTKSLFICQLPAMSLSAPV